MKIGWIVVRGERGPQGPHCLHLSSENTEPGNSQEVTITFCAPAIYMEQFDTAAITAARGGR